MSRKLITIIGARPQFVKAAAVSRALRSCPGITEVILHTGQHYDPQMSDVFFSELEIPRPLHHLGVGSGSHGAQTGRMLEAIENILLEERPSGVLVYGDTNSTLAGALAASKLSIPIFHVESGLRSFNRAMPEEINRVVTDHLSEVLFTPSATATVQLRTEGIDPAKIHEVGDVMFDATRFYAEKLGDDAEFLAKLGLRQKGFVLATIHRPANTDDPTVLERILTAFSQLAETLPVILPLHPRTAAAIQRSGLALLERKGGLRVIPPAGYLDMIRLERSAALIATDSGGVQKEAMFLKTPCVTLRSETEWVETVSAGWNRLCSVESAEEIVDALQQALNSRGTESNPYGDGAASDKIVSSLQRAMS